MKTRAEIIRSLPPLPSTWGVRSNHDSEPCNRAAWDKHVRELKRRRDEAAGVQPLKRVRKSPRKLSDRKSA